MSQSVSAMSQRVEEMEVRMQAENQIALSAVNAEMAGSFASEQYRQEVMRRFTLIASWLKKTYTTETTKSNKWCIS